jgi:membrane-associated protein
MDPNWLLDHFGSQFFWISLIIVFVECGLLFPILPGDTLLFAVGLFVAANRIPYGLVESLLALGAAAFLGNVAGHEIGRLMGPRLYDHNGRLIRKEHLEQTSEFFDRHGNKALVIGRFIPVVRTFVTVVTGVTGMDRQRFFLWSFVGAVLWVASVTLAGYFLGQTFPGLGENIDTAILLILAVSVVPLAVEWWRRRKHAPR